MNSFDPTVNGLYYNATQQAALNQAAFQNARKTEKEKGVKKPFFSSMVEKHTEEASLISIGLPPEIAGLSQEDALVFLKDRMDLAGDALSESATADAFNAYKKAVGHFIKFLEKNNYEIEEHKRKGISRKTGKPFEPRVQVRVINEKLDQLCRDIWYNHLDKLHLLQKVHEINGLVIDLTAA